MTEGMCPSGPGLTRKNDPFLKQCLSWHPICLKQFKGDWLKVMKKMDDLYKKRDMFLEMEAIARRQKDMVTEDRMDRFLELSRQREELQQRISSFRPRAERFIGGLHDASGNGRVRALKEDVTRVIQSIQDIDRQIEAFVSEKRDGLLHDIRGLRKGRKAVKGYGGRAAPRPPRFIDTKG